MFCFSNFQFHENFFFVFFTDDGAEDDDDEQAAVPVPVFVSKNAEMPEGVRLSDGDDNDSDEHANDDPHR